MARAIGPSLSSYPQLHEPVPCYYCWCLPQFPPSSLHQSRARSRVTCFCCCYQAPPATTILSSFLGCCPQGQCVPSPHHCGSSTWAGGARSRSSSIHCGSPLSCSLAVPPVPDPHLSPLASCKLSEVTQSHVAWTP